ncbi:MAG: hypothetical protein HUU38_27980 [Anaerolineales bacterium]|jgi:hypothetical protein|nr:hypothetical protein [Anaerolineales bacterium]
MSALPTHPRYSFIVRIWFELEPTLEGYAPALRGSVQQAGSPQVAYFHTFDKLISFLEQMTETIEKPARK